MEDFKKVIHNMDLKVLLGEDIISFIEEQCASSSLCIIKKDGVTIPGEFITTILKDCKCWCDRCVYDANQEIPQDSTTISLIERSVRKVFLDIDTGLILVESKRYDNQGQVVSGCVMVLFSNGTRLYVKFNVNDKYMRGGRVVVGGYGPKYFTTVRELEDALKSTYIELEKGGGKCED